LRIACLHTIESNIEPFEAARRELGSPSLTLRHEVRADLLAAVGRAGSLSPAILAETVTALQSLGTDADGVLLTCSTLGPAVIPAQRVCPVPVTRVDQGLAGEAVKNGGKVLVLCTVPTTLSSTRDLFEAEARATGATIEVRRIPDAWDDFKAGQLGRYYALTAQAADAAFREGATTVVLAQVSMAPAAALCREGRPLVSPTAGLKAVVFAAERTSDIRTGSRG
jgi:Asp/Glu/hydantoin racemase